ncbi:flagellar basal body-associated FliL family protein [Terriglobus sp.]|uniref:flagellar basal body-associated FliL family protein n=1 Tax=Terriglobus sp. TaxID=1889013 RepID=UPI003B00F44C
MSSSAAVPAEIAATAEPKAKGGMLSMLLAGLLSSVIAAGAVLGAGTWLLHSGKLMPPAAAAKGAAVAPAPSGDAVVKSELPPSKVMALEPMVVNLSDAGGRAYLRASISLRLAEETAGKAEKAEGKPDPAAAAGKTAALRDTTLSVLGAQTSDGLLGAGGVPNVKKLLRERYALDNPEVHVLDVYFTDFLVQRG